MKNILLILLIIFFVVNCGSYNKCIKLEKENQILKQQLEIEKKNIKFKEVVSYKEKPVIQYKEKVVEKIIDKPVSVKEVVYKEVEKKSYSDKQKNENIVFKFEKKRELDRFDLNKISEIIKKYKNDKIKIYTKISKIYKVINKLFYGETFNLISDYCLVIARELIEEGFDKNNIEIEIISDFNLKKNKDIYIEILR